MAALTSVATRDHRATPLYGALLPARRVRRLRGKSDPIDAIAAARTVLSGDGVSDAKDTTAPAESLRFLLDARTQLVAAATAITSSIRSLLVTAPDTLRERYRTLHTPTLIRRLAETRPGQIPESPAAAAAIALRQMARTCQETAEKASRLEAQMRAILTEHYPGLLDVYGVGTIVAAQLAVTGGGNPERIHSEAAFAMLCGAAPIPASSGKTTRHRLNRGGDRRGNNALHRIALVRMRYHQPTRDYVQRRTAEGKSKKEILRCLKRAIAREVYRTLTAPARLSTTANDPAATSLRTLRNEHHLTLTDAAHALSTWPARISDIETGRRPLPNLTKRYRQYLANA